jgi:hypothetical protein
MFIINNDEVTAPTDTSNVYCSIGGTAPKLRSGGGKVEVLKLWPVRAPIVLSSGIVVALPSCPL